MKYEPLLSTTTKNYQHCLTEDVQGETDEATEKQRNRKKYHLTGTEITI